MIKAISKINLELIMRATITQKDKYILLKMAKSLEQYVEAVNSLGIYADGIYHRQIKNNGAEIFCPHEAARIARQLSGIIEN